MPQYQQEVVIDNHVTLSIHYYQQKGWDVKFHTQDKQLRCLLNQSKPAHLGDQVLQASLSLYLIQGLACMPFPRRYLFI